jgi:hypothetical protein
MSFFMDGKEFSVRVVNGEIRVSTPGRPEAGIDNYPSRIQVMAIQWAKDKKIYE